jgi:splicing factor 3B subunit 3
MDTGGQLNEYTERKDMNADVICMALASVPVGELRTRFLAVGLADDTVRIISLDPKDCLSPLASQGLPSPAESLSIVEMKGLDYENAGLASSVDNQSQSNTLFLNIGLQNGALLRTVLDPTSGELLDTRTRYLGSRPVKLFKISIQG